MNTPPSMERSVTVHEKRTITAPAPPAEGEPAPQKELSRTELEDQLRGRHDAIKARIEALQHEVVTTGAALKDAVARNPFVMVGGAVAAGLVVGLLFGGRRRGRIDTGTTAHQALVRHYLDAVVEDVRHARARGVDTDEAVAEALRDRVPLIVYAPQAPHSRRGMLGEFFVMALQTGLGFAAKAAADYFSARLVTMEEEVTVEPADGEGTRTTVKRTVSEPPAD